ncbi:alpha and gamma adaptin binding protein p34 [Colletotrichum simmondsii]|uniref:Alpha and gamma adaptin binding protein p34 n=1 Tax=Colletotrichum simmondsii TaxID=703756 RepID=A0A135SI15_9PEZI|nr:alpha and gamma adaptin binding protein p34 [Colletotrichum simmondsii]
MFICKKEEEEKEKEGNIMLHPKLPSHVSQADWTGAPSASYLTGTHPEPASTTLAGTTHILPIKTSYYTADVPIWLDLVDAPAEWSASFLSPEAKEVLTVLGGLAVVFALPSSPSSSSSTLAPAPADVTATATPALASAPSPPPSIEDTRALITEVGRVVREGLGGWGWDGVGLGIGVGDGTADEWEDLCAEWGLEFVQVRGGKKDDGRNEFGVEGPFWEEEGKRESWTFIPEPIYPYSAQRQRPVHADIPSPEKMGIARVLEALESNDWDAADDMDGPSDLDSDLDAAAGDLPRKPRPLAGGTSNNDDGDDDDDEFDLDDPENLDFGFDRADFEGLKKAIWNLEQEPEEDDEVVEGGATDTAKTASGSAGGATTVEKPDSAKTMQKKKAEDAEKEDLDAEDVEKIEQMMRKLQAVRDLSAGLPEDQRRRMAKKAVGEVMKEL